MKKNHERYLAALLTSATLKEAAEKAGITPRGLRNIMRDQEFIKAYNALKKEIVDDAARHLQGNFTLAIDTLSDVMQDAESKPGEKTSAARAVLEFGQRFTETADILARLDALERNSQQ